MVNTKKTPETMYSSPLLDESTLFLGNISCVNKNKFFSSRKKHPHICKLLVQNSLLIILHHEIHFKMKTYIQFNNLFTVKNSFSK